MRLWSLHPKYLDQKRIVAVWREGLLAKKVLEGNTKGYRNHPQLTRFRELRDPVASVCAYLEAIHANAVERGYKFDRTKLPQDISSERIPVTASQLEYEFDHLTAKLNSTVDISTYRRTDRSRTLDDITAITCHPLFFVVPGDIEEWEVGYWRTAKD